MTYIFGNTTNAREGYENPSLADHDLCVNAVDSRLLGNDTTQLCGSDID